LTAERDTQAHLLASKRDYLAHRYLSGDGIEIGALHRPLPLPPGCTVRYVDRFREGELREHYPELANEPLAPVTVLDDGETLSSVADSSVDFVVANHFVEHCEDPIRALTTFCRVTRPHGTIFIAIPDKRVTFDRLREETTLAHVLADHERGPQHSRAAHFEEWAKYVENVDGDLSPERVEELRLDRLQRNYSIHFHAWSPLGFLELLSHVLRNEVEGVELVETALSGDEFLTVLRQEAGSA
jgi:SAM-dependent methyltransferase